MIQTSSYLRTGLFFKICEWLLVVIAADSTLTMGLDIVPRPFLERYGQIIGITSTAVLATGLLIGLGYIWVWHRRERAGTSNSGWPHTWMQGIIRYWLALLISTYGFAKILGTQFTTPSYRHDIPLGEANGFVLTWYYYAHSYTLAVIIALLQIGGSVLLLYRRTTLLGVMILLPVMINIVLINVFFEIGSGAFFNSVIITLGLLFLLFIDWAKLKRAFWDLTERLPPVTLGRHWVKHGLRVLPLAAAFALIEYYVHKNQTDTLLGGTWKVERFTRNGQVVPTNAWLTDSTAWSRVYFAGWQGVAFSPNPYRYKPDESLRGNYEFDSTTNQLQIVCSQALNDNRDTLWATVSQRTTRAMRLRGVWYGDTLDMQLARLR